MGREKFMEALEALTNKLNARAPGQNIAPPVAAQLETVESLQRRVLTVNQLDAIAQIQDAITAIAQMEAAVNKLATLHALPVARLQLTQTGKLWGDIEGLLFEHGLAATRLNRGGLPVDAPSELRPPRPTAGAMAA